MLQKMIFFVLLWGPLFVGAPVRPNMLNICLNRPLSVTVAMFTSVNYDTFSVLYVVRAKQRTSQGLKHVHVGHSFLSYTCPYGQ